MWIRVVELVQLVQENGGIKFAIVPGPEPLNGLMNCFFVPIVEQICDFSGPVLTLMVLDSSAEMM